MELSVLYLKKVFLGNSVAVFMLEDYFSKRSYHTAFKKLTLFSPLLTSFPLNCLYLTLEREQHSLCLLCLFFFTKKNSLFLSFLLFTNQHGKS